MNMLLAPITTTEISTILHPNYQALPLTILYITTDTALDVVSAQVCI
jgi:hypothetical protein